MNDARTVPQPVSETGSGVNPTFAVRFEKPLYGSVSLLLSFADYPLIVLLPIYIGTTLGFGLAATGYLFAFCRVLDVVTDLAVGNLTDRLNRKRDGGLLLTLVSIPVFVVCLCNLFWIDSDTSWTWLASSLLALYIARTLLDVPHASMGARLQIRRKASFAYFGARAVFAIFGMLLAAIIVSINSGAIGMSLSMIAEFAIAAGIVILTALVSQQRTLDSGHVPFERGLSKGRLREVPKDVWRIIIVFLLSQTGTAFAASLMVLYIGFVLQLETSSGIFLGVLFASGALSVPFWVIASNHFDHQKLWAFSMVFLSILFLLVPTIGAGQFGLYFALCLLAGICFGADAVIPSGLIAVILRKENAQRVAGTVFGLKALVAKAALVLPVVFAFPLLEYFGLGQGVEKPTETALLVLVLLYAIAPLAFKCPAAWLILSDLKAKV